MNDIKRIFRPERGFGFVEPLDGYIFSPESYAHKFIITQMVKVNGADTEQAFAAGSTVSCRVLKSDQVTELVEGTLESGAACVTLPTECYSVPGKFLLTILVTTGSTITCVYAASGTVIGADSENVNVSEGASRAIDDKIAEINAAASTAQAAVSQVQAAVAGVPAVIASIPQDYTALSNSVGDLKSAVDPMLNTIDIMTDKATYGNNNTAMTNNGDGSVTIGNTDNGNTTFGSPIELTAGDYYLYGVPNGIAFLTTVGTASSSYTNRVFENTGSAPKRYHTDSTVSVYVAFRSPSRPSTAYTVYPALYKLEPVARSLHIEKPISFNGNYFTDTESTWNDGFYRTGTGVIDSSDTLQYAFCPLVGIGDYIEVIRYSDFGSNATVIGFVDDKYRFVKSITGIRDGNNVSFSVSADDLIRCKYVVIRRDKTKDFSPKLFYNAPVSGGIYNEPPKYGYSTSNLYKKIVVCDGDSICVGYVDNPKQFGAWFGRLQNNYQMTGKNYAVNGGTITDLTSQTPTRHSLVLTIDTIYSEYPQLDYLILEGGTNDADLIGNFDGDTPPEGFGTWSDENVSDYNGNYDNTTFCGAVEELFYKAVTYWPNAKIGFIVPMQMGTLMVPSKRRRRYFDEIIKIAAKWHINVLDLWNISHADARLTAYYGGTEGDLTKFYYDGQHPTSVGYDLIQPIIEAWMKTL